MQMQQELSSLGQFPILQFFGGLFVLIGVAFAVWRATQDSKKPAPQVAPTTPPLYAIGGALADRDLGERMLQSQNELSKNLARLVRIREQEFENPASTGQVNRICEEVSRLTRSVDELTTAIRRQA